MYTPPQTPDVRTIAMHGQAYIAKGWKLVPIPIGQKAPATLDWNAGHNLIKTAAELVSHLAAGPINLGLCHEPSGTCAVDVDDMEHTRLIFDEFGIDYDDIMRRGLRIRSREGRDKAIFAAPPGLQMAKLQWPAQGAVNGSQRLNILELRAGPSQDVLPPSVHPSGMRYEWWPTRGPGDMVAVPGLPENLKAFWLALLDRSSGLREEIQALCPWRQATAPRPAVRARPAGEHSDVIGAYNNATPIGELLESYGYRRRGRRYVAPSSTSGIPGVNILEGTKAYSHHGSDVLADGYAHDAFGAYTLLEHNGDVHAAVRAAALHLGIERRPSGHVATDEPVCDIAAMLAAQERRHAAAREPVVVDPETGEIVAPAADPAPLPPGLQAIADERRAEIEAAGAPGSLPPELHHAMPGAMGQYVEWVLRTAMFPQPELTIAGAIAVFGAILGGQVAHETRTRTNFYTIGVAPSSAGKEHTRACAKELLRAADLADTVLGPESVASSSGITTMLHTNPSRYMPIDEFGRAFASWVAPRSSRNDVVELLLSAFTSSSSIVKGAHRADAKLNPAKDVVEPNLCIHGTTTGATLWPALAGSDAASGLLGRMLIFSAPEDRPPRQRAAFAAPPPELVEWVRAAVRLGYVHNSMERVPLSVPATDIAEAILFAYQEGVDARVRRAARKEDPSSPVDVLWGRAGELAAKLALLLAVAGHADAAGLVAAAKAGQIAIDEPSASLATKIVDACLKHLEAMAGEMIGDSDHEREKKEVLRFIRKGGTRGRTRAELYRSNRTFKRLKPREADEVLDALIAAELVGLERTQAAAGRPREAYVATAYRIRRSATTT